MNTLWTLGFLIGLLGASVAGFGLRSHNPMWKGINVHAELSALVRAPADSSRPSWVPQARRWLLVDFGFAVFYTLAIVSMCALGSGAWSPTVSSGSRAFVLAGFFFVPIADFIENAALWMLLSGDPSAVLRRVARASRILKFVLPAPWFLYGSFKMLSLMSKSW